jgi:hypothetical protein
MLAKLSRYWRRDTISPRAGGSRTKPLSHSSTAQASVPQEESALVPVPKPDQQETTYRIWRENGEWLWQVNSPAGDRLGFGRAASSVKARAAAFRFCLDTL